jgi:hypothetical protein
MERRDLPISYGLPDTDYLPPPLVEAKQFPNYREFVLGSCCVIASRDTRKGLRLRWVRESFQGMGEQEPSSGEMRSGFP